MKHFDFGRGAIFIILGHHWQLKPLATARSVLYSVYDRSLELPALITCLQLLFLHLLCVTGIGPSVCFCGQA